MTTGDDGGWARGDSGDDYLFARGDGYHRLEGGPGDDLVQAVCDGVPEQGFEAIGDRDADTFYFYARADEQDAVAHARDFVPGEDRLHVGLELQEIRQDGVYVVDVPASQVFHDYLDTDNNGLLDGTDPASGFASSFVLGSGEHGIGLWVGDGALVVELPEDVAALTADDFLL